ncbi:helix-turn-helix transcriptional regulator [Methylomagnum sp.]
MKTNQALAYIRQLCCLGLSQEAMIGEFLRAVKSAIPSSSNVYVGLGENRYPNHVIPEYVIPEVLDVFIQNTAEVLTPEMVRKNLSWFSYQAVLDDPGIIWKNFYRGDFFNLVWRPYDQYHCIQALLRADGAERGFVHLFRSRSQPGFSVEEKNLFAHLLPYVEHGLTAAPVEQADHSGGEFGMFVMDSKGGLIFVSETARNLLRLARYPHFPTGTGISSGVLEIPPALSRLCHSLDGIFRGEDKAPPEFIHTNARGRFVFRAQWLDPMNREPGGLMGVTVEHQEPTSLRLLRRIGELPLSPGQMDVCLLLAQGHAHEIIGQRLNIKLTTVRDHVRKIYDKLGIRQREDLLDLLGNRAGIPR